MHDLRREDVWVHGARLVDVSVQGRGGAFFVVCEMGGRFSWLGI